MEGCTLLLVETEETPRGGEKLLVAFVVRALERVRGGVSEFIGQRARELLQHFGRILAAREAALRLPQLAVAHRIRALPQRADRRHCVERTYPLHEIDDACIDDFFRFDRGRRTR